MATDTYPCPECGNDVTVQGRNNKDAASRARFCQKRGDICNDCDNARLTAKGATYAAEHGLPALEGSEKQVAWAETIRMSKLQWLIERERPSLAKGRHPEDLATLDAIIGQIKKQTSAKWFIETRGYTLHDLYDDLRDLIDAPGDVQADEAPEVLQPETPVSDMIVTITVGGRDVVARSDAPDDRLRDVLRDAGLRWDDTRWARRIPKSPVEVYGAPTERAAELARDILAIGFPVLIPDPIVRDMAISGEFAPEATRYCSAIAGTDDVLIRTERDEALNDDLRETVPGARWARERRGWRASGWRAAEVRDYCERHGLLVTEAAEARLAACERALQAGVTVKVPPKGKPEPTRDDILVIPEGIDPSLLDDV